MEAKDFVQLSLLAMGGEIQGKTKLQKTVYLLALMTDLLDDLGYRAYYYGPYSDDVADAVGWLKTIGAVDQSSSGVGAVDHSGFEIRRHDFRLNEQGRRFAEATARRHPQLWETLKRAASVLRQAGDLDYMAMSIAAKTRFMLDEHKGEASQEELARLAPKFGWKVTPKQIQDAASYLQRLGLVDLTED